MLGGGTPLLLLTYYYYIPHYHSSTCPGFTVLALGPGFRPIFIHSFIVAPGAKQHRSCMHCDAQAAAAICCCPVIHLREAGNIQRPVEKPGSTHCTDAQAWVGMRLDAYTPHPPSPPASLHATGWHPHAGLPGGKVGEGRRAIRGEKGQPCISNKGCGLLCTLLWSAWVRLGPPGSWAAWVRLGPGPPGSAWVRLGPGLPGSAWVLGRLGLALLSVPTAPTQAATKALCPTTTRHKALAQAGEA